MSKKVMHQEFHQEILRQIKSGKLKNGDKIPPERTLCELYNISRTTVREALRNLEIEGYVVRIQGSGNYVNIKPIHPKLTKLYTLRDTFNDEGITHEVKLIKFETVKCSKDTSQRLEINIGDDVLHIARLFLAAGIPYTMEYTYLPKKLFTELTQEMVVKNGLYATLEKYDKKPTSASETIKAVTVNSEQRKLLKLPDDILAIEIRRTTKSGSDVIEYTKNIIRNDYFVYTVTLGE